MTTAAKRAEMNAVSALAGPPSSNAGAMPVGADPVRWPPWAFVFAFCLLLYVVHAAVAIAAGRHLFLDGSWYLVRLLSDGWPISFYSDLLTEFYYSRLSAVWATQWPSVLYLRLGGDSLAVSSWLFGASMFGAKIVLLLVSLWILRPEHRQLIVFPLLSLFAGTIGADPVIISEAHFAAGLLWPLLFAASGVARSTAAPVGVVALCGALAPLTYESFLFFGPILMLGAVAGVRATDRSARLNALLAGLSGLASTVISAASVAFPRDTINRGSFRAGLENVLRDMVAPGAEIFVPVLLATVALAGVVLALLASRTRFRGAAATAVLLPFLVFLLLFPIGYSALRPPALAFPQSYLGRSLTLVLIPAGLALLCLLHVRRTDGLRTAFLTASFTVLPALAAGQVGHQLMLTGVWARSASVLADALGSRRGRIACEEIAASASTRGLTAEQFRHAVCAWPVAPLSLLVQQPAGPQSVAFADVAFQPFDTRDGSGLPSLRFVRVPLDRLRASLDEAAAIGPR